MKENSARIAIISLIGAIGLTFLFSTHDQRLLDRSDRVVRLCDGRVVEDTGGQQVSDGHLSAAGA